MKISLQKRYVQSTSLTLDLPLVIVHIAANVKRWVENPRGIQSDFVDTGDVDFVLLK